MVGTTTPVRKQGRRPGCLDQFATGGLAKEDEDLGTSRSGADRAGTVLPDAENADTQDTPSGLMLQQLWFQLPHDDRVHFGDCFSRMLLRAVETCRFPLTEDQP